jgi:serine/threonine protein kinase
LHRDLKSLNILLDEHEQAKIADFGLAKVKLEVSSTSTKSHKSGSVRWRAPELFKRGATPNTAWDVNS